MSSARHAGVAIGWAKIGHGALAKGTYCRGLSRSSISSHGLGSTPLVSQFSVIPVRTTCLQTVPCLSTGVLQHDRRTFSKCCHLQMPRGRPRGNGVDTGRYGQSEPTKGTIPRPNDSKHSARIIGAQESPQYISEFMKSNNSASPLDVPPEFPSDVDKLKMQQRKRDQTRGSHRPKIDPGDTSVLLFPGQGSQFVGMGEKVIGIPKVQDMYDVARDILGYDLLDLCLNGPKEKLDKTVHCQPAVFVASLAAVEKLKEENGKAIEHCVATAGFSVGEFAALVFAGALTFEEGLEIVQKRAVAMQAASEEIPGGMMTAILGPDNRAKMACHTAKLYCTKELGMPAREVDCVIANFLYPECKVIAGNDEALDFIVENSREFGIRRTKRLAVSGAFHSRLMHPAQAVVAKTLQQVQLKVPLIDVHSNVDAHRYSNVKTMIKLLSRQMCESVKWEQIQHKIFERPRDTAFPNSYECGPGRQLGSILKMTNFRAYNNYRPVDV